MADHDAVFYVRIQARRSPYTYRNGAVDTLAAVNVTQNKPANLPKDTIAVKLTVRIPDAAFDALTPEAVVVAPAELVQRAQEIDATVGDASEPGVPGREVPLDG